MLLMYRNHGRAGFLFERSQQMNAMEMPLSLIITCDSLIPSLLA
jgi:hypothetical protein